MAIPKTSPAAAPRTFRAGRAYIAGPGLFVLLLLLFLAVLILNHHVTATPLPAAVGIAFLGLFVTAITLRITMDADGLAQHWIWGRRRLGWHQIASIERTKRGLYLLDAQGKEILAVSALPPADQQVIVDEAVKRGRLRRDKQKPKPPVLERWVRR